jgi:hypothetical protein
MIVRTMQMHTGKLLTTMIVACLFLLTAMTAQAAEPALIAKIKKDWRAQDGETAEQIFTQPSGGFFHARRFTYHVGLTGCSR